MSKKIQNNGSKSWLKNLFILLIIQVLIFKLFGYNYLDIFYNTYLLKVYVCVYGFLMILHNSLYLYFIHKFSKNNILIPDILPLFIINWFKEVKMISQSKLSIQSAKETLYIYMTLYIISIILTLLIF